VQDLTTHYHTLKGNVQAVDRVSFNVQKGEAMGLAGESGCGKTTIALSLMRMLPLGGRILGGKIFFEGIDILELNKGDMRNKIRWQEMALVFQGAMNALNPVYSVGDQIIEAILTHEDVSKNEARERTEKLLEMVGLDPSRADNYPYEFSGGMRQRALIAMAIACNPSLLIADEPGTALDVIVQAQVLSLLKELKKKLDLAMIMITHDLSIIAETCEKTTIMYAGKIAESGDITTIFLDPAHPYTQGLIGAFPNIKSEKRRMTSIPGMPPDLVKPPSGCRFNPRCAHAMEICRAKEPPLKKGDRKGHLVACHLY